MSKSLVTDGTLSFEGGQDAGKVASLIGPNQVASAINATFRMGYASPRPALVEVPFKLGGLTHLTSVFQCAIDYTSDDGRAFILLLAGGETYLYDPLVKKLTQLSSSSAGTSNPSNIRDGWMEQAENFVVIQDGVSKPLIFDGATLRRAKVDEIKTGKVMRYANGRIWYALPQGYSFRATDLVYSDGTRASVLKETENTFLNEGGDFAVPSDSGGITAMAVPGNLDTSLGQGPLLVFTPRYIFSINAPFERATWKNLTYPVQTVSQVTNGALSPKSTVVVNGDVFYRSVDGVRSFIIARRNFGSWGNTPVSNEVAPTVEDDTTSQLRWGSAIVVDNRMLMTASPVYRSKGTIHKSILSLDFDLVTGMREKLPPAWEGIWTGLDILQLVRTQTALGETGYVVSRNPDDDTIRLWQFRPDKMADENVSGTATDIQWSLVTRAYSFGNPFNLKRLDSGDLYIDRLHGTASFDVKFRPDQYPGWVDWNSWNECATTTNCVPTNGCLPIKNFQPQYRTKTRLPSTAWACNSTVNSQMNNLFEAQARIAVTGYCRIKSFRVHGTPVIEPVVGDCRTDSACKSLEDCDIDPLSYRITES